MENKNLEIEEIENKSYHNSQEVLYVYKCVNELNKNNVELKDIGVLPFYSAQKQRLYGRQEYEAGFQDNQRRGGYAAQKGRSQR